MRVLRHSEDATHRALLVGGLVVSALAASSLGRKICLAAIFLMATLRLPALYPHSAGPDAGWIKCGERMQHTRWTSHCIRVARHRGRLPGLAGVPKAKRRAIPETRQSGPDRLGHCPGIEVSTAH